MTSTNVGTEPEPALWATQGGGLARHLSGDTYVWYELPDWMTALPDGDKDKAAIGDPIPPEWGLIPANQAAMDEMSRSRDERAEEFDSIWGD